jgi:hypothetical protein
MDVQRRGVASDAKIGDDDQGGDMTYSGVAGAARSKLKVMIWKRWLNLYYITYI